MEQIEEGKSKGFRVFASLAILPLVFVVNNMIAFVLNRFLGMETGLVFFAFMTLTQHLLLISCTFYLVLIRWDMSLAELGLQVERLPRAFWQGLTNGPLVFLVVTIGGVLVERVHPIGDQSQPFTEMVLQANNGPELFLLGFLAVVLAPLAEEIYFRGLLFTAFRGKLGVTGGIVVSGLVFGLLHFDVLRFFPIALGGMVLAWIYHKTNSVYAPMTAHGVWNGLMLTILMLAQKGQVF